MFKKINQKTYENVSFYFTTKSKASYFLLNHTFKTICLPCPNLIFHSQKLCNLKADGLQQQKNHAGSAKSRKLRLSFTHQNWTGLFPKIEKRFDFPMSLNICCDKRLRINDSGCCNGVEDILLANFGALDTS